MIWAVMGDIANAMPEIRNTKQRNTKPYDVCSDSSRNSTNPMPTKTMPADTIRCAPKRAASRGVNGATIIMIGAIGRMRSAAPRGL